MKFVLQIHDVHDHKYIAPVINPQNTEELREYKFRYGINFGNLDSNVIAGTGSVGG